MALLLLLCVRHNLTFVMFPAEVFLGDAVISMLCFLFLFFHSLKCRASFKSLCLAQLTCLFTHAHPRGDGFPCPVGFKDDGAGKTRQHGAAEIEWQVRMELTRCLAKGKGILKDSAGVGGW